MKIQAASKDKDHVSEEKDQKLAAVIDSKQNVPKKREFKNATVHIKSWFQLSVSVFRFIRFHLPVEK